MGVPEPGCEPAQICLRVSDNIYPFISEAERTRNIVLLDFDADLEPDASLRLDLDIRFSPVRLKCGVVGRFSYYVGSTGIEITLIALDGIVSNYTKGTPLRVIQSTNTKRVRQSTLNLQPTVEATIVGNKANLSSGGLSYGDSTERLFTTSFESVERCLESLHMGDRVKWVLALPRAERVVRDFLVGNLYLSCKCNWGSRSRRGSINVCPSDVQFFDEQRRPLDFIRSLYMRYSMWREGVEIENWNGFQCEFEEIPK